MRTLSPTILALLPLCIACSSQQEPLQPNPGPRDDSKTLQRPLTLQVDEQIDEDIRGVRPREDGNVRPVSSDPIHPSDGVSYDHFGEVVSNAGDLNGDGYDDVIIGAYGDDDGAPSGGAVYVYLGGPDGLDPNSEVQLLASDADDSDFFGRTLSGAGDVNGDGYDDIIVGAYENDDDGDGSGSAYLFYGGASGIDAWSETKLTASDAAIRDYFGYAVAGAGDVNGDGFDDVLVGAHLNDENGTDAGSVYLYLGSATGILAGSEFLLKSSDSDNMDQFGVAVAGAGDVNADGYDDIIVGAETDETSSSNAGSAYVYLGSPHGIDLASELRLVASDGRTDDFFGGSVSSAGDIDGDGFDDVIVGADGENAYTGAAYVYTGGPLGIDAAAQTKLTASDASDSDYFGGSVSSAGDVNGDGFDDVIIGAKHDDDSGTSSGSAYVFHGQPADFGSWQTKLTADDGIQYDYLGLSVSGAGDWNGDGFDDVIVGAHGKSGGGGAYSWLSLHFDLTAPTPGTAGVDSELAVTHAAPGFDVVWIALLSSAGTTPVPGCPGLELSGSSPVNLGSALADDQGHALITTFIPAEAAGGTATLVALQPDLCAMTHALDHTF